MFKLFKQAISPEQFCQNFYDDVRANNEIASTLLHDISISDTSFQPDKEVLYREILALRLEMMSGAWMKCFLKPKPVFTQGIVLKKVIDDSVLDRLIQYNSSVRQGVTDLLTTTKFPQTINAQNKQRIGDSYREIGKLLGVKQDVVEMVCNRLLSDVVQREDWLNLYAPVAFTFCSRIGTELGTLNNQAQIILMRFIRESFEKSVKEIKNNKIDFSLEEKQKPRNNREKWSDLNAVDFEKTHGNISEIYGYANRCFMKIVLDMAHISDLLKKIEKDLSHEINKEAFLIELNKIRYSNACLSILEQLEPENDTDMENINLAIGASTKVIFGRERIYESDEIDDLYKQWILCMENIGTEKSRHENFKFKAIIAKMVFNVTHGRREGYLYDALEELIVETENNDHKKFSSCAADNVKYILSSIT